MPATLRKAINAGETTARSISFPDYGQTTTPGARSARAAFSPSLSPPAVGVLGWGDGAHRGQRRRAGLAGAARAGVGRVEQLARRVGLGAAAGAGRLALARAAADLALELGVIMIAFALTI